jgi:hypothetical protein
VLRPEMLTAGAVSGQSKITGISTEFKAAVGATTNMKFCVAPAGIETAVSAGAVKLF